MCLELSSIITVCIFIGVIWFSVVFLKGGVQDIVEAWKYQDKWGAVKGVVRIVIVPILVIGVVVVGLFLLELIYVCK